MENNVSATLKPGTKLNATTNAFWNACAEVAAALELAGIPGISIFVGNCFPRREEMAAEVRWMNQPLFSIRFEPTSERPQRTMVLLKHGGVEQLRHFSEWESFFREKLLDPIEWKMIALLRLRRMIDRSVNGLLEDLATVAREPVEMYRAEDLADLR